MTGPTKRNADAGTSANSQSRYDDTAKPTAPAESSQHSRRPDRYRLPVPAAWDVPGGDAFRILETHWGRR